MELSKKSPSSKIHEWNIYTLLKKAMICAREFAKKSKVLYRIPMNQRSSRSTYLFSIFVWGMLLASTIVIYSNIVTIDWWSPPSLQRIDTVYLVIKNICIIALIASIVNLFLREIRHSSAVENIIIRRFLPIIRFFLTASIWIIGIFHIFEELNIDTKSILTWAWIWWAILVLAGKDIMTNLFWSMSILLGRIFDIGENIRIRSSKWPSYEGLVEEITLNYTKITNKTGELVYIPNRTIYTEVIENLSRQRYFTYTYLIPFAKNTNSGKDVSEQIRIIEWKISEYDPLQIEWETENPNASDFLYKAIVKFPEENERIDKNIREFLMKHIFHG